MKEDPLAIFVTAEVLSDDLRERHGIAIPADRIRELTQLGYMPHYFIDGAGPFFRRIEAKKYIRDNLIQNQAARPFPTELKVIDLTASDAVAGRVPDALVPLAERFYEMPVSRTLGVPCVYFLISDMRVVYVGQTTNLIARVTTHLKEKTFDRVLYLPVPESALLAVEAAFIAALRPPLNGRCEGKPCLELERFREMISPHLAGGTNGQPALSG